jgi:hypothetical protein
VIPVPDHVPPEEAAVRLKEEAPAQTEGGCVMVASRVDTELIVTCDELGGQAPLLMVHWNTLAPVPNPVTPEVGEDAEVIVPAPLMSVHTPVPIVGVFPANVAVVPHTFWVLPAAAVVGGVTPVIVTWLVDEAHEPFEMLHSKTFAPEPKAVIPDVGEVGAVTVPAPLINVHVPLPVVGVLPAKVAVVPQTVCGLPATDIVGGNETSIVTWEELGVHGWLLIVHWNTFAPVPNPVNPDVGEDGAVMVPEPLISVHKPVPEAGVFPANVAVVPQIVWLLPAIDAVGGVTPVIVTWLVEAVQEPFEMLHSKTFGPVPKAVIPDVAEVGVVTVPAPLINVHIPVPDAGVFPAKVALVPQTVWGLPATAVLGGNETFIVTCEELGVHGGLLIVHWNTFDPAPKPVKPDVGEDGVVIVPVPLTKVHKPEPTAGVCPASVAVVPQMACVVPAADVVGGVTPVIVTWLVEAGQEPFEMLHWNTFAPAPKAVMPDVGEEGVVIVPAPLIKLHVPVPVVAVFPAKVAVVPQTVWGLPATDVVGAADTFIVTVEELGVHGGLLIVHWNTFDPAPRPVKPDVGEDGVVIVPVPLTNVHKPEPTAGVFPASVAVVPQIACVVPAADVVGGVTPVIATWLVEAGQEPFEMLHWNTFAPAPKAVMPDVGEEGVVIVPAPLIKLHVPVPVVAVFPAKVAVVPQTVWGLPATDVVGAADTFIVTVEELGVHGGLLIVHWKTFAPVPNPVSPDVAEDGVVIVPVPLTSVHRPEPEVGELPANVAVVPQTVWGFPATEVVGAATPVIVTWLVDGEQPAKEIVHWKTFAPVPNPVIPEVGEEGVVIVPAPLISDHAPVPVVAVFPANVAVVPQMVCGLPAAAVVGPDVMVTTTGIR